MFFLLFEAADVVATYYPDALNLTDLTAKAERIFLGEVVSRTTGQDLLGHPATVYTFRVEQGLKGTFSNTITIKQIGVAEPVEDPNTGVITFPIDGIPVYEPGHRYLLFLNGTSTIGFTSPVGGTYGAFAVSPEGKAANGFNNAGLLGGENSGSHKSLSRELLQHKRGPINLPDLIAATARIAETFSSTPSVVASDSTIRPLHQITAAQPVPRGNVTALFNGHPFRWNIPSAENPGGTLSAIPYDVETGTLGSASNAAAIAKVAESFGKWTAPSTTSLVVTNTPGSLGVDVDANCPSPTCYLNWYFVFGDGRSPIIFDNDGSIINAITGNPCTFVGLGGFQGQTSDGGLTWTIEGSAVLNGAALGGVCGNRTLDEAGITITHEIGHFLGIHHTIVNGELVIAGESFLDFGVPPCSSVELMLSSGVPGCARPNVLHKDDVSVVSRLYPSAAFAATTGKITGNLFAPDGATPVNCGNMILRNLNDPFFDVVATITGITRDTGTPPPGQSGFYYAPGLTLGASYIVGVNQIPPFAVAGRHITGLCDPIPTLPGPEEFYNGSHESSSAAVDNPTCFTPVIADALVSDIDIILNGTSSSTAPCSLLNMAATSLPGGEVEITYITDLGISGDSPPFLISVVKGSRPAGLSLDNFGIISGTPTVGKSSKITVKVIDQSGSSISRAFTIKILKVLGITTTSLKAGKVGKKYSAALKGTGGQKPYFWSIVSGTLPSDLLFDSATGKITGTPLAPVSVDLTFQVTDPLGGTDEKQLTLTIN
jgi:hypothetical protein